jgi:WD40 repeat protein
VTIQNSPADRPSTLIEPQNQIPRLSFSRDGQWMTVRFNGEFAAEVWNLRERRKVGRPLHHDSFVMDAVFDTGARRVLTLSGDQTARVWSAADGQPLTHPFRPVRPTGDLAIRASLAASDRVAITLFSDDRAQFWDAATGEAVTPELAIETPGRRDWWFSPEGDAAISVGFDGSLHSWTLRTDARTVGDLRREAALLSAHRIDETGGFVPLTGVEYQQVWSAISR